MALMPGFDDMEDGPIIGSHQYNIFLLWFVVDDLVVAAAVTAPGFADSRLTYVPPFSGNNIPMPYPTAASTRLAAGHKIVFFMTMTHSMPITMNVPSAQWGGKQCVSWHEGSDIKCTLGCKYGGGSARIEEVLNIPDSAWTVVVELRLSESPVRWSPLMAEP